MVLKVGDKLIFKGGNIIDRYFTINETYIISEVRSFDEKISYTILDNFKGMWYFDDRPDTFKFISAVLVPSSYIVEFFYTPREIRKLKLKQLYENI